MHLADHITVNGSHNTTPNAIVTVRRGKGVPVSSSQCPYGASAMPHLRNELRHIAIPAGPCKIGMYGTPPRAACADVAGKAPLSPQVCAWGAPGPAPPWGSGSSPSCLFLSAPGPWPQRCSGCLNVLGHAFLQPRAGSEGEQCMAGHVGNPDDDAWGVHSPACYDTERGCRLNARRCGEQTDDRCQGLSLHCSDSIPMADGAKVQSRHQGLGIRI